ncbi:N-acetyltransferase [Bacteroidia bacterium]|nr:N-acetyltransferase [Bacteroidia bacterium]
MEITMEIRIITGQKKEFLDLLLLADEQESMIDRYLESGTMFALYDDALRSIAVVTQEDRFTYELKNLATDPESQHQGYARHLIEYLCQYYKSEKAVMMVGTGEGSSQVNFYMKCGFHPAHVVENFFVDNYDHPIIEDGKQIRNMIYLKREL